MQFKALRTLSVFVLLVNLLIYHLLAYFMSVSYLSNAVYYRVYESVLRSESIGVIILAISVFFTTGEISIKTSRVIDYLILAFLFVEILMYGEHYFTGYGENSQVGSVLFEFSCFLTAFRLLDISRSKGIIFYLVLVCTVIISLGTGKRLPLSYIFMALLYTNFGAKKRYVMSFIALFLFTSLGYLWSVWRDSFSLQGIAMVFTNSNHGGTLHSAGVYWRALSSGYFSAGDRILLSVTHLFASWILPTTMLGELADLKSHIQGFDSIQGNGGLMGTYLRLYFGWLGLPLLFWFSILVRGRLKFLRLAIYLSIFRVSMYNWVPSIRLMSYTIILMTICMLFFKVKLIRIS